MSNETVSPDQMQARIQQARREAENLKDRIKRKKDELADGSRECPQAAAAIEKGDRLLILVTYIKSRISPVVNKRLCPRTK